MQDNEIKLFCSVSRVNICFIAGLVLWQKNCTFLWQKKVLCQKKQTTVQYCTFLHSSSSTPLEKNLPILLD